MAEIIIKKILRKNYINVSWQAGNGEKFQTQNLVDGEKGNVFTEADSKQIDMAVTGAARAFETVRLKDMESRANLLDSIVHYDGDPELSRIFNSLEDKVGRIILNNFPTGVEVCPSMHPGGADPSSTFEATISVGTAAIERFCTVKCYQNIPQEQLPAGIRDKNHDNILRMVNGVFTTENILKN